MYTCIVWNNISLHSTSTTSPRHRQTAGEDHFEVCRPIRRGDSAVAGNGILRGTRLCRLMPGWNCQREQQSGTPNQMKSNGVNVQKIIENLCHYSNVAYSTNECNKKIQKLSPAISKIWCTLPFRLMDPNIPNVLNHVAGKWQRCLTTRTKIHGHRHVSWAKPNLTGVLSKQQVGHSNHGNDPLGSSLTLPFWWSKTSWWRKWSHEKPRYQSQIWWESVPHSRIFRLPSVGNWW